MSQVDILFAAWNRLAFTQAAFGALLANTDWQHVHTLHIHDDGSTDGTALWLADAVEAAELPDHLTVRYEKIRYGSPVAVMARHLEICGSPWFVKLDNDACVPPGWLEALLTVRDAYPGVDLIGMEAGMTAAPGREPDWDGSRHLEPCTHIGGIGLMRRAAFDRRPLKPNGRFGWQDFQLEYDLNRGWITPDLPLVLLDRLPFQPWAGRSASYEDAGWQRPWPKWDATWMAWAWEWFAEVVT